MAKSHSKPLLTRLSGLFTENENVWKAAFSKSSKSSPKTNKEFFDLTRKFTKKFNIFNNVQFCKIITYMLLADEQKTCSIFFGIVF
jgi:transposase-like protein